MKKIIFLSTRALKGRTKNCLNCARFTSELSYGVPIYCSYLSHYTFEEHTVIRATREELAEYLGVGWMRAGSRKIVCPSWEAAKQ